MPGNKEGKAKAKGPAGESADKGYWRKATWVSYTQGERPPPPLVPRVGEDTLDLMSPKSQDTFAEKAEKAAKMARSKAAKKRAMGLQAYGFNATEEGPRRSARLTSTFMSPEDIAADPRQPEVRKADRRAEPAESATPACNQRGISKVDLITPPAAGPSG